MHETRSRQGIAKKRIWPLKMVIEIPVVKQMQFFVSSIPEISDTIRTPSVKSVIRRIRVQTVANHIFPIGDIGIVVSVVNPRGRTEVFFHKCKRLVKIRTFCSILFRSVQTNIKTFVFQLFKKIKILGIGLYCAMRSGKFTVFSKIYNPVGITIKNAFCNRNSIINIASYSTVGTRNRFITKAYGPMRAQIAPIGMFSEDNCRLISLPYWHKSR